MPSAPVRGRFKPQNLAHVGENVVGAALSGRGRGLSRAFRVPASALVAAHVDGFRTERHHQRCLALARVVEWVVGDGRRRHQWVKLDPVEGVAATGLLGIVVGHRAVAPQPSPLVSSRKAKIACLAPNLKARSVGMPTLKFSVW